jgi:hypothetical protein
MTHKQSIPTVLLSTIMVHEVHLLLLSLQVPLIIDLLAYLLD